jgi:hypothetical protein
MAVQPERVTVRWTQTAKETDHIFILIVFFQGEHEIFHLCFFSVPKTHLYNDSLFSSET